MKRQIVSSENGNIRNLMRVARRHGLPPVVVIDPTKYWNSHRKKMILESYSISA